MLWILLATYSIEVKDISLTDYIQTRHAVYVPHTAGRYAKKQFKKAQMPIVERLVDRYVEQQLTRIIVGDELLDMGISFTPSFDNIHSLERTSPDI